MFLILYLWKFPLKSSYFHIIIFRVACWPSTTIPRVVPSNSLCFGSTRPVSCPYRRLMWSWTRGSCLPRGIWTRWTWTRSRPWSMCWPSPNIAGSWKKRELPNFREYNLLLDENIDFNLFFCFFGPKILRIQISRRACFRPFASQSKASRVETNSTAMPAKCRQLSTSWSDAHSRNCARLGGRRNNPELITDLTRQNKKINFYFFNAINFRCSFVVACTAWLGNELNPSAAQNRTNPLADYAPVQPIDWSKTHKFCYWG